MSVKCVTCCGELLLFEARQVRGDIPENERPPQVDDAWTFAPSWQQQVVGAQMVMACVALPTCKRHMTAVELSAADKAVMGGKILLGRPEAS